MNNRNSDMWISVKGIEAIISNISITAKTRDYAIELLMAKKENGHNTKIDNVRIATMTALVELFNKGVFCENPGAGGLHLRKEWVKANQPHFIVNTDLLFPTIVGGNVQARLMSTLRSNSEYINFDPSQVQVYRNNPAEWVVVPCECK